jgi:hypothetical protein
VDGTPGALTGADGAFVALGFRPGLHVIEAVRPGYLPALKRFVATPRGHTDIGEALLIAGDLFRDGRIDVLDVMLAQAAFGRCSGSPTFQAWLDLDGDGCVTTKDLDIVMSNFGRVGPTNWSPVPEP